MVRILLKFMAVVLFGGQLVLPQTIFAQEPHPTGYSLPQQDGADSTAIRESGTPVHVQLTAVVIHLDKLRQIGLHWDLSKEKLDEINEKQGGKFYDFVHSLTEGDSAQVIFAPQLRVIAGQKLSLEISSCNLEVAPKFQENGDIQMDLAMKGLLRLPHSRSAGDRSALSFRPPDASIEMPFDVTKKVVVRPGETIFLVRPESEVQPSLKEKEPANEADSKVEENTEPKQAVLFFAQVDTKPLHKPDAESTVAPNMDPPSLKPSTPGDPHYSHPGAPPPPVRLPSSVPMSIPSTEY